jgi:hypothetical protein
MGSIFVYLTQMVICLSFFLFCWVDFSTHVSFSFFISSSSQLLSLSQPVVFLSSSFFFFFFPCSSTGWRLGAGNDAEEGLVEAAAAAGCDGEARRQIGEARQQRDGSSDAGKRGSVADWKHGAGGFRGFGFFTAQRMNGLDL